MRLGGPLSFVIHVGLLAAGIIVAPQLTAEEPAPMMVLPVELLTIADTTNVAAILDEIRTDEVAEETTAPEASSTEASGAAAPESAEILPTETAPEPRKEETPAEKEVKAPDKPTPDKQDDAFSADSFLKTINKNRAKDAAVGKTAANPTKVTDAGAPRRGVGDETRMTVSIADYIRSQLMERGCWVDQDDMPDAQRLRATIRVKFEKTGKLMGEPELIEPSRLSASDRPMQIFVGRALRALHQCDPFQVPAEYHQMVPARWIDLTFVP